MANALRPGYAGVMVRKAVGRLRERRSPQERRETESWLKTHTESSEDFTVDISSDLALKSDEFAKKSEEVWLQALEHVSVELGGAADYRLLFFLTRLLKPSVVVETGVAAGRSSVAILSALRANGHGHLYSSDFPYFRLRNPKEYIGILVDDDLRKRWTLDIRGDRKSLPRFVEMVDKVELFHYDSDKTFRGRQFALDTLSITFTDDSVIMFDDIGDNDHFRVLVEAGSFHFHVFAVGGKYVGLVGRFCTPFH